MDKESWSNSKFADSFNYFSFDAKKWWKEIVQNLDKLRDKENKNDAFRDQLANFIAFVFFCYKSNPNFEKPSSILCNLTNQAFTNFKDKNLAKQDVLYATFEDIFGIRIDLGIPNPEMKFKFQRPYYI